MGGCRNFRRVFVNVCVCVCGGGGGSSMCFTESRMDLLEKQLDQLLLEGGPYQNS